jgi:HEAT repeat protein
MRVQRAKQIAAFAAVGLSFMVFIALYCCGCEEATKQGLGATQPHAAPSRELLRAANRILRESLSDTDPRARANAVEVCAATKYVPLMPKVQRLLNDRFVPVRFLATLAIGDAEYALAKTDVQRLLQAEDKNVQIGAAYAMYKLGHKEYLKVFRDAVTSQDQTVRANATLLLGKSGDRSTLTRRSLWWTLQRKDSNDGTRFQAAEALAMLGDEQIYPKLWAMLISAYADDRVMGIRAMGALGTKRAKNAIVTMLDDAVLEVRLAAAAQLGKLGEPLGEEQVQEVYASNLTAGLSGEDLQRVRVLTALAIGQIGTEPLKKYLPELLGDASKSVRIAAAKAVLQYAMQG